MRGTMRIYGKWYAGKHLKCGEYACFSAVFPFGKLIKTPQTHMYWVGTNTRQGYRQLSIRIFPMAFWQSKSFGRVCVACLCTWYYTISSVIECKIDRTSYGGFESPCLSGKENRAMRHWHSFLILISMAFHGKSCYSAQWALRFVTMARIYIEKKLERSSLFNKTVDFCEGEMYRHQMSISNSSSSRIRSNTHCHQCIVFIFSSFTFPESK